MQFAQLQYAVEIERCGSITEAARNLFIAQPNLSKSLRELEEELFPLIAPLYEAGLDACIVQDFGVLSF